MRFAFKFLFCIFNFAKCLMCEYSIWSIITKFWTPNTFKNINILSEKLGKIHFFSLRHFKDRFLVCLPSWCIINKTTPDTLITILLNFLTGNEIHFICGGKILRELTTFTNVQNSLSKHAAPQNRFLSSLGKGDWVTC